MILTSLDIQEAGIIEPFRERTIINGKTYGASLIGYDIRVKQTLVFTDDSRFRLGSSIERFTMPRDLVGLVKDKSSWARRGLSVFNTVIEPGWCGYLTLELAYHDEGVLTVTAGDPIAQVIFQETTAPTRGYIGKYQNQPNHPVSAIDEVPIAADNENGIT